jgi:tetratricopeptide (TPR) repeat protein
MNTSYLLEVAYQRFNAGHEDGAMDSLRQLLAEDPECAEAHALLALCLLNMRRLHAGRHEARLALAKEPMLPLAHYVAALIDMAARRFKSAEQHLLQVLDLEPMEARYYRSLADLRQLTGRRKESLPLLEKALELQPDDPANLVALAEYHQATGNWEQAHSFARQALQADPTHAPAVIVLGHLLLREGDINGAREHAIWALQENANNYAALGLLTAVKARSNVFMGVWWRFNRWMNERGSTGAIILLLGMFLVYRVTVITLAGQGYTGAAQVVDWLWLAFALYTFTAPQIFKRAMEKEISQVKLSKEF